MYNRKFQKMSKISLFWFSFPNRYYFWSTFLESFLVIIRHSWGMFTDRDHTVYSLSRKATWKDLDSQTENTWFRLRGHSELLRLLHSCSKTLFQVFIPNNDIFLVKLISRKFSFHEKKQRSKKHFEKQGQFLFIQIM